MSRNGQHQDQDVALSDRVVSHRTEGSEFHTRHQQAQAEVCLVNASGHFCDQNNREWLKTSALHL